MQTLSFDTGADVLGINANAARNTTARTLTLNGGTNALGTTDLIALSAATTGTITLGGASGAGTLNVALGADGAFNVANAAANLVFGANSVLSGAHNLTKTGAGTLTLVGVNTYTGGTTVSAGTLSITGGSVGVANSTANFTVDGAGTGASAAAASLSGGSLSAGETNIGYVGTGTFIQSGGSFTTNSYTLVAGYEVGGSGTFTLSGMGSSLSTGEADIGYGGTGTCIQSGGSFTTNHSGLVLGFLSGGTGTFTLSGGTLTTAQVKGSGGTSTFNFNGGTLQASASDNPAAASNPTTFLTGLTTANVQAGGTVIDTNGFNVTVAQPLLHDPALGATFDGGLIKLGAGTLTLSNSSTYTGGTLLSAGTLAIANNRGLGMGNVTVAAGGQLTLNAGVVITNMTGTTLTLNDPNSSTVNLLGTGVQDTVATLIVNGAMQINGTYGAAGSGAQFTLADFLGTGELQVTAVPEPSTWMLLSLGVAGLLGLIRRQRQHDHLA